MSGDHTRFTFDPRKRYSGVRMQQGRVSLDSDWNEAIDIVGDHARKLALDSFGPAGVSLTTPNAFLIAPLPGPDLAIAEGRIYVDGLLAEIFDGETPTYLNQPFLPEPPPLPAGDAVVYLDVWEREVTYIEDPALLDVALGGADTATRTQTVWQLRADSRRGATCGMPVGDPPSAGRLTTQAIAPPAPDDPCILPPIAGYRGLENRLYRVEIHTRGPLGTALFKWSRDNGSIASAVRDIAVSGGQSTLAVDRIGRDPVLRLRIDDWVTVTDDHRELMGTPGVMARIVDIHETARQIVLDRALPLAGAGAFGINAADLASRHTRVQRWDETATSNAIDADGLIATAAGPIPIEDGIDVLFSVDPAGGGFRAGDYWVFAARTADASVELLTNAPPRGIVHHYLQLAAITVLPGGKIDVTNCRPPGHKDEHCCCIVVAPGEDIQQAIDALPAAGGCVCLLPGIYPIEAPIFIRRDNVTLKCESAGAVVRIAGRQAALAILDAGRALVSRIDLERDGEAGLIGLIVASGASRLAIEDCGVIDRGNIASVGIAIINCRDVRVARCMIEIGTLGLLVIGSSSADIAIVENHVEVGRSHDEGGTAGIIALQFAGLTRIEANIISGVQTGIRVNDSIAGPPASTAEQVSVTGNTVVLAARTSALGKSAFPGIGIDLASSRSRACDNRIIIPTRGGGNAPPDPIVGIRLTGVDLRATGNIISTAGEEGQATTGLQAGFVGVTGATSLTSGVRIAGNSIAGCAIGIAGTSTLWLDILDNHIAGGARTPQSSGIALTSVVSAQVCDNHVTSTNFALMCANGRANRFERNDLSLGASGVFLAKEASPIIAQNRIAVMSGFGIAMVAATGRCDVTGNRITNCGYAESIGAGVIALNVVGELNVKGNEVLDTGLSPDGKQSAAVALGVAGLLVLEGAVEGNLITYSNVAMRPVVAEDRALLMQGLLDLRANDRIEIGFGVAITNNKFIGVGRTALVELREKQITDTFHQRFENVLFHNNYCSHLSGERNDAMATVTLLGRAASVMGNHVMALNGFFSFNFNGMPGPFIGNVTSGDVLQHADFPTPQAGFNMNI